MQDRRAFFIPTPVSVAGWGVSNSHPCRYGLNVLSPATLTGAAVSFGQKAHVLLPVMRRQCSFSSAAKPCLHVGPDQRPTPGRFTNSHSETVVLNQSSMPHSS